MNEKIYSLAEFAAGNLQQKSLAEFLAVRRSDIISFAGAGGKTSALFALAAELQTMYKVLIATTTKMYKEKTAIIVQDATIIANAFTRQNVVIAGSDLGSKMGSFPLDFLAEIAPYSDITLLEADGAKRLPFKFPQEHEPVYIPATNKIVYLVGMKALNKPIADLARAELLADFLQKSLTDSLQPADIVKVLVSEQGAQKAIGKRAFFVVLNQVDDDAVKEQALAIAESVQKYNGNIKVALTKFV